MNEFLEQLVRDLTNAYSRSQKMFGERVSPGPANQRSFLCLPCCWGQLLLKHIPWTLWLIILCLSPYQRVFYALASWCPSQRTRDFSKCRDLIVCVQTTTPTANFWAQIILDPYRRPLTLTFLLVSTRGLFHDMMFDRLHYSTLSEDASEVLMQPLPCGTEKANSVARVVAKPTPRLCSRCASNTLIHSGYAGFRILGRILDLLLAKKILAPRWCSNLPKTLNLKVCPSCCKWCFSPLKTSASRTLQSRFSNVEISLFQTCGKDYNFLSTFHPTYCVKDYDTGWV